MTVFVEYKWGKSTWRVWEHNDCYCFVVFIHIFHSKGFIQKQCTVKLTISEYKFSNHSQTCT